MLIRKPKKSRFQPIFDYMDEHFAKIEADIEFMKQRIDNCVAMQERCEKRWQINDRRYNQQMEILQNQQKRITTLELKSK